MDDIKEIKEDVKELLQRSAVHNQILAEHKAYSIALQNEQKVIKAQIEPLIKDHHLIALFLKACGAILIGVTVQAVVRHFLIK